MREFAFTVRFDRGADDLMDLFVETPDLEARSQACFANDRAMWRVDDVTGPADALERLDEIYLDEAVCNECLDTEHCESTREYHVLDRGREHRMIYTRREAIGRCHSVPSLAVEEVGDGVLLEAIRDGDAYVWLLLVPDETAVGRLYDRVRAKLRDGLSLELSRVTDADRTTFADSERVLTTAERATLETAAEADYYGVPRGTTVAALADALDTPRSTVQYRLQRAEEKLVDRYLDSAR